MQIAKRPGIGKQCKNQFMLFLDKVASTENLLQRKEKLFLTKPLIFLPAQILVA
jgi:hypothetical protein